MLDFVVYLQWFWSLKLDDAISLTEQIRVDVHAQYPQNSNHHKTHSSIYVVAWQSFIFQQA